MKYTGKNGALKNLPVAPPNKHPKQEPVSANGVRSYDPCYDSYHSNAGTSSEGHCLVERRGSSYKGTRGYK